MPPVRLIKHGDTMSRTRTARPVLGTRHTAYGTVTTLSCSVRVRPVPCSCFTKHFSQTCRIVSTQRALTRLHVKWLVPGIITELKWSHPRALNELLEKLLDKQLDDVLMDNALDPVVLDNVDFIVLATTTINTVLVNVVLNNVLVCGSDRLSASPTTSSSLTSSISTARCAMISVWPFSK